MTAATLTMPDTATLKAAFGAFPCGVVALCAEVDGERHAMVASSFTVGVSFDPPLVLFSAQNASETWPLLRRAERIGVSILGTEQDSACLQLSRRGIDRLAGVAVTAGSGGSLLLDGAPVWLECSLHAEAPAGDHTIVVLQVEATRVDADASPLVYHRSGFHRLAA